MYLFDSDYLTAAGTLDLDSLAADALEWLSEDYFRWPPRLRRRHLVTDPKRPNAGGLLGCSSKELDHRIEAHMFPPPLRESPRVATWNKADAFRYRLHQLKAAAESDFPRVWEGRHPSNKHRENESAL
jgi:hypothetical protein